MCERKIFQIWRVSWKNQRMLACDLLLRMVCLAWMVMLHR